MAVVTACSSAPPPPAALENNAGAGSAAPQAGASPSAAAPTAPVTRTLADGTKVTTVVRNGQTITTSTKNGKTVSTTTPATSGPVAPINPGGSHLFKPAEEQIGLTSDSLTMCAHAALTYGQAFGTKDTDFNVFWDAINAEKNGIYGRKVHVTYENDDYKPTTAVQAATACKAKGIFMLLGGIGFDQIPAVRNWAEQNRMLYVHHTATIEGTRGQKFSFSELPTVERTGEAFAQLAVAKFKNKKIGIIERDSSNWTPGVKAFKVLAKKYGLNIVADTQVANNKGSYTDDLLTMKNAGVEVVWAWMNALESTELLKQAKSQQYSPNWMMFPFNLTSQTLGSDAMTPPLDGVAMYPAYSKGDYSGKFASYADDMKEFERQYAQYDSGIDLSGIGGDLLFLNWTAQKALYIQLLQCGKDCTRDKFIDVLRTYKGKAPTHSSCPIDFSGDGYHGSDSLNFMETYNSPSGKVNWRNTALCVRP
jgi:ABC-type branched-subunit amino acid transport system substrate-binding protein